MRKGLPIAVRRALPLVVTCMVIGPVVAYATTDPDPEIEYSATATVHFPTPAFDHRLFRHPQVNRNPPEREVVSVPILPLKEPFRIAARQFPMPVDTLRKNVSVERLGTNGLRLTAFGPARVATAFQANEVAGHYVKFRRRLGLRRIGRARRELRRASYVPAEYRRFLRTAPRRLPDTASVTWAAAPPVETPASASERALVSLMLGVPLGIALYGVFPLLRRRAAPRAPAAE